MLCSNSSDCNLPLNICKVESALQTLLLWQTFGDFSKTMFASQITSKAPPSLSKNRAFHRDSLYNYTKDQMVVLPRPTKILPCSALRNTELHLIIKVHKLSKLIRLF